MYSTDMSAPFVARRPVVLLVCHLARYSDASSYVNQYFLLAGKTSCLISIMLQAEYTPQTHNACYTNIYNGALFVVFLDTTKVILCLYTPLAYGEYMRYTSNYS